MERIKVICPRPQIAGDGAESKTPVILILVWYSLYDITSHRVNTMFC